MQAIAFWILFEAKTKNCTTLFVSICRRFYSISHNKQPTHTHTHTQWHAMRERTKKKRTKKNWNIFAAQKHFEPCEKRWKDRKKHAHTSSGTQNNVLCSSQRVTYTPRRQNTNHGINEEIRRIYANNIYILIYLYLLSFLLIQLTISFGAGVAVVFRTESHFLLLKCFACYENSLELSSSTAYDASRSLAISRFEKKKKKKTVVGLSRFFAHIPLRSTWAHVRFFVSAQHLASG